jgi:hypothetical protein
MPNSLLVSLEKLVDVLDRARKRVIRRLSEFLEAIIVIIENIYEWFVEKIEAIIDYLIRLSSLIIKLLSVLIQFALLYLPCLPFIIFILLLILFGGLY